jgi:DNA-3-methyladenine glycosylase I
MAESSHFHPFAYRDTFAALQRTLHEATTLSSEALSERFATYDFAPGVTVVGTDDQLYKKLVEVVFYSGMNASKVTKRMQRIHAHFADFRLVAQYTPEQITAITGDQEMLKHPQKIQACVKNAKRFVHILASHASIADYFNSFGSFDVDANLERFRDALIEQFGFLSEITVYHYMMELALNVAKPDRVLSRVFHRLGLVSAPKIKRDVREKRQYYWDTIQQARAFATATGENIRRVDISVMALGQEQIVEFGLKGICLEVAPRCGVCQVKPFCTYSPSSQ